MHSYRFNSVSPANASARPSFVIGSPPAFTAFIGFHGLHGFHRSHSELSAIVTLRSGSTRITTWWPMCAPSHRTLFSTSPRRADKRGGTSNSDPVTPNAQALRPDVRPRSPRVRMDATSMTTTISGAWSPPLYGPTISHRHSLSLCSSVSSRNRRNASHGFRLSTLAHARVSVRPHGGLTLQ